MHQTSLWAILLVSLVSITLAGTLQSITGCRVDRDCYNGGTCLSDGTCSCIPGFQNDKTQGITNCSLVKCENNGTLGADGICQCTAGWSGVGCNQCITDSACASFSTANSTGFCDRTFQTAKRKFFECNVGQEPYKTLVGNRMQLQCEGVPNDITSPQRGVCNMQLFDSAKETIYCRLTSCYSSFSNENGQNFALYKCDFTSCNCSAQSPQKCGNPILAPVLPAMFGSASIKCNTANFNCEVAQAQFPVTIPITCSNGSECLSQPLAAPPVYVAVQDLTFVWIGVGLAVGLLGVVLLAIIGSCIFSMCESRIVRKQTLAYSGANHSVTMELKNVTYMKRIFKHGRFINKVFLNNVNYVLRPGTVTAIMGPSGSGKTTLLDILAFRRKSGSIKGTVLVNGRKPQSDWHRISGYVYQEDLLMETMTVKECIMFSANTRLPDTITKKEKEERVNKVMEDLRIDHIADRSIGSALRRGISGGEKRRVSIAMELVVSPNVMFLDEATSGLDSHSALVVMNCLCELAKQGRTIAFSIHQPRPNIFERFDEIILLNQGEVVYAGDKLGALQHFKQLGHEPGNLNPADFLIDALQLVAPGAKVVNGETSLTDVVVSDNSGTEKGINDEVETVVPNEEEFAKPIVLRPYATSFYRQLYYLSGRSFRNFYRDIFLMPVHFFIAIVAGFVLGAIYFKLNNEIFGCQNRIGVFFFTLILLAFAAMSSLDIFLTERAVFVKERANGYYRPLAYFIAKTTFDLIPLRFFPPLLLSAICYYMIGLSPWFYKFLIFTIIMILFNLVAGSVCIAIGSVVRSAAIGNVIAIVVFLIAALFSGYLAQKNSIPVWLSWIKWISFWNYAFEGLMINEFYGLPVILNPEGFSVSYASDGNFYLMQLGMDFNRLFWDVIILAGWAIFYVILSGVLLIGCVREKR